MKALERGLFYVRLFELPYRDATWSLQGSFLLLQKLHFRHPWRSDVLAATLRNLHPYAANTVPSKKPELLAKNKTERFASISNGANMDNLDQQVSQALAAIAATDNLAMSLAVDLL